MKSATADRHKKVCSRCRRPRDRRGQRYCRRCHNEYMREYHERERRALRRELGRCP